MLIKNLGNLNSCIKYNCIWKHSNISPQIYAIHMAHTLCRKIQKFQKCIYLQQVWKFGKHLRRSHVQTLLSARRLLTVRHVTQIQDGRQDWEYPTRNTTNNPNVSDPSFPPQNIITTTLKTFVLTVWLTVSWWPAGNRPSPSPAAVARSRAGDRPHLLS